MMPYLGDTVTWLSNDIDPKTPAGLCKALRTGADICLTGASTTGTVAEAVWRRAR
jgi:hypothetical protein